MTRRYLPSILLLAAIWGASYLFIKVGVRDFKPATLMDARLVIAFVPLFAFIGFTRGGVRSAARELGSVVALGVVGLGVAYVIYFGLITGAGASRAILVTYLVPPMALFYGATILDESLSFTDLAGLALILAGVSLGTGTLQRVGRRRATAGARA